MGLRKSSVWLLVPLQKKGRVS